MQNLLSNLKKEDVQNYPFRHIIAENVLPDELATRLMREYPPYDLMTKGSAQENARCQLFAKDALLNPKVSTLWKDFIKAHLTQEYWDKFVELFDLKKLYPNHNLGKVGIRGIDTFDNADVLLEVDVSINTPTSRTFSVRTAHTDIATQILTGLYYLRLPEDDSTGGDLELYKWKNRPLFYKRQFVESGLADYVKTFPYKKNSLICFPNAQDALHGVSPRNPTKHFRLLVGLIADVKTPLFGQPQESKWMRRLNHRAPTVYSFLRKLV